MQHTCQPLPNAEKSFSAVAARLQASDLQLISTCCVKVKTRRRRRPEIFVRCSGDSPPERFPSVGVIRTGDEKYARGARMTPEDIPTVGAAHLMLCTSARTRQRESNNKGTPT
jgi:hypothetical protein